jgi:ribosomal protein S18 acetylase RimI-like enzyme
MPEQQRFGIGGMLIDAAAGFARDKAADGIWLSVWEDAPWAVNCYRKNGFESVGTTEFQLGKTVYADLLMWRPT